MMLNVIRPEEDVLLKDGWMTGKSKGKKYKQIREGKKNQNVLSYMKYERWEKKCNSNAKGNTRKDVIFY